jgi:hypothetical protein
MIFAQPPTIARLAPSATRRLKPLAMTQQQRFKVILNGSHPFEYFKASWDPKNPRNPPIHHPQPYTSPDGQKKGPLYFKITLKRSLVGTPWDRRLSAGILFKQYSPDLCARPKFVRPRISVHTVIYREASPEVAKLVLELKELVNVENVWTEEDYRREARSLLGRHGMTPEEHQAHRGYFVVGNVSRRSLFDMEQ